ncbi:MAG: class I SAM-dependent methyltransferase [Phycisphaerales bacterium]|nr:class I SAM-dependent methyltransferase [Phycisphaerales bacterium]
MQDTSSPGIIEYPPLPAITPPPKPDWAAAIRLHGIGRGEYVALVFSGPLEAMGDIAGHATWNTARKFSMPDPRCDAAADLGRCAEAPLADWNGGSPRPTPGVCFVLSDHGHPARAALERSGGVEFEDFVTLDRLSPELLTLARVRRLLARAEGRAVAVLGLGDQGRRTLKALREAGGPGLELLAVDAESSRHAAADELSARVVSIDDPTLNGCAIVSTPLSRPRAFDGVIARAVESGRAVIDNSLGFDDAGEFRSSGPAHLTAAAHRVVSVRGMALVLRPGAAGVGVNIVRVDTRLVAGQRVSHLQSGQRGTVGERAFDALDLSSPPRTDRLSRFFTGVEEAFVGIDGQSNQHDAALGVFAARAFLSRFWPQAVATVLPSQTRASLGATPFERCLSTSITGRTLGAPYLTSVEQAALGVLAQAYASNAPIIEIGSALGGSAVLMAAATGGALAEEHSPPLLCIDPDAETRPAMQAVIEHAGFRNRVRMIDRTSDEAADHAAAIVGSPESGGGGAGLIFIDGMHTLEQSRRDYDRYLPMLRVGGAMLFHDMDARFSGVIRTILDGPCRESRLRLVCIAETIAVFERVA